MQIDIKHPTYFASPGKKILPLQTQKVAELEELKLEEDPELLSNDISDELLVPSPITDELDEILVPSPITDELDDLPETPLLSEVLLPINNF